MRTIPSSIINKIEKAFQTKYNNADPRIELVIQRTKKYIEEGTALQPFTVREGTGLGAIDLSLRRENHKTAPDKIFMVYVQNGIAKVASIDYISGVEKKNEWELLYELGPAVDVATEFDGYWMRTTEDAEVCFDSPANWTHVTKGEPWFFMALPNGSLIAKQGESGVPVTLATDGVTKVSAIRGWKSTIFPANDQGLIVAYIRNGTVCYRTYAEQENGVWVWESEKTISQFNGTAVNVAVFRTNDFRVGFAAEIEDNIYWVISKRNWAGMAIEDHTISVYLRDVLVSMTALSYYLAFHRHTISASLNINELALLWNMSDNRFISAYNDGDTIVHAETEHFLTDLTASEFEIIDAYNAIFSVTNIVTGLTPNDLILTVDSLNYSYPGTLTLKFIGSGTTKGEAGQDIDPFEIMFIPTGLEYIEVDPPEVEAVWNE